MGLEISQNCISASRPIETHQPKLLTEAKRFIDLCNEILKDAKTPENLSNEIEVRFESITDVNQTVCSIKSHNAELCISSPIQSTVRNDLNQSFQGETASEAQILDEELTRCAITSRGDTLTFSFGIDNSHILPSDARRPRFFVTSGNSGYTYAATDEVEAIRAGITDLESIKSLLNNEAPRIDLGAISISTKVGTNSKMPV